MSFSYKKRFANLLNIAYIFSKNKTYKPLNPFSIIHRDVWDPNMIISLSIKLKWFITLRDDDTKLCWIYLLKDKCYSFIAGGETLSSSLPIGSTNNNQENDSNYTDIDGFIYLIYTNFWTNSVIAKLYSHTLFFTHF